MNRRNFLIALLLITTLLAFSLVDTRVAQPLFLTRTVEGDLSRDTKAVSDDPKKEMGLAPASGASPQDLSAEREIAVSPTTFHYFAQRARDGDGEAAYTLYSALRICRSFGAPVLEVPENEIDEGTKILLRQAQYAAEYCGLYSPEQLQDIDDWLLLAAESGGDRARLTYYFEGAPRDRLDPLLGLRRNEYKQRALAYLKELEQEGHPEVYWYLSDAYSRGVIVERDPYLAYRYYLVSQLVNSEEQHPINPRRIARLQSLLTEDEVRDAENYALTFVSRQ